MALTDPVPSQAIDVFKRNMEDSDRFVNQTSGTVTNRTGKPMRPLPVISDDIEQQITDLTADINAAKADLYPIVKFRFLVDTYEITNRNELGDTATGETYRYIGAALPFSVTPATNPVGNPDFVQVIQTDHNNLTNRNNAGAHDASAITYLESGVNSVESALRDRAVYMTIAEAQAATLEVGQYVRLTDFKSGLYKVVDNSATGGLYKTGLQNNLKLELIKILGMCMVEHYVSNTTGLTNVYPEVLEVVNYAKTTGCGLVSAPSSIFNMGAFPDTSDLSKLVIDTDGFRWDTNGCEFVLTANLNAYHDARTSQVLFEVEANDVDIGDIKVTADAIARDASDRQGVHAYWLRNHTRNTRNNKLGKVDGTKLISCITATSTDPSNLRLRGLEHGKLFNDGGYYVLNCAENGDGFTGKLSSNDCIRTYFCYGVKGHRYDVDTYNHLKFSDVVISRFSRNTEDIVINYTCHLSVTSVGVISFEHINDDPASTISNVTINFNVTVSNPANPSINFKSFTAAGAAEVVTNKSFSEIRLFGATNSTTPLSLATEIVGKTKNSIYIEKDELISQQDTKGYNFIVGKNRIAFSNADGGMTCKFNVSELIFTPSWGKLTIFATNNAGSFDDTYIIRDYYIAFAVSSDGSVAILNTPQVSEVLRDVLALSPTITFPAQPVGSYQLQVNLNNYTGVNRIIRGSLELFSAQSPF